MDPAISAFTIKGLCAANFQAFTASGAVDTAAVAAHAANLRAQKVTSVFACGTTGEGSKLSIAERKAMLEAWVAAGGADLAVIAHVGAESLADAKDLAAHAAAAGAVAIGIIPPCYVKPGDVNGCVAWVEAVGAACPTLPVYYYHIPSMNSVHVRCDTLLAKVAAAQAESPPRLRNFRGIKYSDADLHIYATCVASHGGRFDILYGKDEQALGALAMGAKGFIGSTYNYIGRVAAGMIASFAARDMDAASAAQRKIQRVVDLLLASGDFGPAGCNVGKAILEARIAGAAWAGPAGPVRLPGAPVADAAKLRAALTELGFFEW